MDKKYEVDRTVWKSYRVTNKHFDEQPLFFSSVQLENDSHFVSSFDMTSLMHYVVFLLWFSFYHVRITNLPQKNVVITKGDQIIRQDIQVSRKQFLFLRPWNLFTSSSLEFFGFRPLSNVNWSPALRTLYNLTLFILSASHTERQFRIAFVNNSWLQDYYLESGLNLL